MKTLRLHILKIWVIALVCCGLTMAGVQPAQASKSSNEFASWLQSLAKKTPTPGLEKKLRLLKHETGDINRLIEQASQIVSSNNEDFNLPKGAASDHIQHILLVEWNQFQSGNAMAAIPSAETIKPNLAPQHHKTIFSGLESSLIGAKEGLQDIGLSEHFFLIFPPLSHFITPLVSGIAIGAP